MDYVNSFFLIDYILDIGVVLSVGRFLRLWVSELVHKIFIDNMEDVESIMLMCEDIMLARQSGDLILEEQTYMQLMELFRSPERLLQKTKKKIE